MDILALFSAEPSLTVVILLVALWTLPWKGYALWHAARLSQRRWFIVLLVVNTLAILEIIYIFFVVRRAKIRDSNNLEG